MRSEIEVLRAKLDALAEAIESKTNGTAANRIKRIQRMLNRRRASAEEQLQYFLDAEEEGEYLCVDYLSALHFELAILGRLDDLLVRIAELPYEQS